MNQLKQIHAHALRNGTDNSKFLVTKLLEIPNIAYAHKLLDIIPQPTSFHYNKLIQAYCSHGPRHRCFSLYSQMLLHNCPPNQHTFTFLFSACASLSSAQQGQKLHTQFIKMGFGFDSFAQTALIDMYAKSGVLKLARQVFDEMIERDVPAWNSIIGGYAKGGMLADAGKLFELMPSRNVVSWTSMVSGYSQNGRYEDALQMYKRMEESGVRPNEVTIASVLPACANLGALAIGEKIEKLVREKGFMRNMFVSNALLEMYAKCGRVDTANQIFDEIGCRKNLCSWNSMIMGFAIHGRWREGLDLFHNMLRGGTLPDDITFVGVLLACTHGGLVKQGLHFFESMNKDYCISPKLQHYGCMVDLLGRAGELTEAYGLIKRMPMKPDAVVWGALLGACSLYGNVELAEKSVEFLLELEPWNPGIYVILSNVYALAGRWDGVAKVRKLMKGNQLQKEAGYSFVEVDGSIHKFIVGDKEHPRSDDVYALVEEILNKMKLLGDGTDLDFECENHVC